MKNNGLLTYSYVAVNNAGKRVKGKVEANFLEEAKAKLQSQKLYVIEISEKSLLMKNLDTEIGGYPKTRDLSVMCRQFVSMVHSGVSITRTLQMLEEQTENKKLKKALNEVRIDIEKGESLAKAMEKMAKIEESIAAFNK